MRLTVTVTNTIPDPGKKLTISRLCHTGYLPRVVSAYNAILEVIRRGGEKLLISFGQGGILTNAKMVKLTHLCIEPEIVRELYEYLRIRRLGKKYIRPYARGQEEEGTP